MDGKYSDSKYPSTREIVYLLGMGALLVGSILIPGLGLAAGAVYRAKDKHEWQQNQKAWKKFNLNYLKRNLKRLKDQDIVEVINQGGQEMIKLTRKGHAKYLKFKLEELSLKGKRWDGKWRIIVYDVQKSKNRQRDTFRNILRYMNVFKLQKSVYITPYSCEDEISYLREYFDIGNEVMIIRADKIENEGVYKEYFGL